MYKVRGIDGKEYGPVSIEMLRQWLAERRLTDMQPRGGTREVQLFSHSNEVAQVTQFHRQFQSSIFSMIKALNIYWTV